MSNMIESDYQRGWRECQEICAAIAEMRLQSESVLREAFPAIDEVTGEDMATRHEWFCKGRESAAANIAKDIKMMKTPCPIEEASYADLRASGGLFPALPQTSGVWQPIETAPKDGTVIVVAVYTEIYGWIRGTSYWVSEKGLSGWISRGVTAITGELGLAHPTHWQPLPSTSSLPRPQEK